VRHKFAWRRPGWCVLIALGAVVVVGAEVRAGPDAAGSIFVAAREAAARGRTEKTALAGFDLGSASLADDPPEGGILVGFEVGVGESFNKPAIYALRPLYLTSTGVFPSRTFGLPQGRQVTGKKGVKSRVTRTVTVQARAGYAVGEIALDTGLNIDGIAVTFLRIQGTTLDPKQSYSEDWVGSHHDRKPKVLSGGGEPIVGVFARQDEVRVMAVGLVRIRPTEPMAPAPAPPPSPRPAAPPVEKAQPLPKPPVEEEPPAPVPEKAAARPPALPDEEDGGFPWLTVAVFAAVTVPLFLGLTLVLRRREPPPPRDDEDVEATDEAPTRAAASSTDLCESPQGLGRPRTRDATGICESPGSEHGRDAERREADRAAEAMSDGPPRYFEARAVFNFRPNRLLRVYVLRDRLLFLDAEPEADVARIARTIPLVAGGALFGLVGGLIAWYLLKSLNQRPAAHRCDLDDLDTEELIARATYANGCFAAAPDDLSEVRLEAPSFWHSLWWGCFQYAGLLRLRHREFGQYTLQITEVMGMRLAAERLPQLLGGEMEVNAVFCRRLWQFVRKE